MMIMRESPGDAAEIRRVTAAAFRSAGRSASPADEAGEPVEATLLDWLRADVGWIPDLSLVARDDVGIVGHVVCTRGSVGAHPALGLGPISVLPERQGRGVGTALMHAIVAAAQSRGEAMIALLGDPIFYARFGFGPASSIGVAAPDPKWGVHFMSRTLAAYRSDMVGTFRYAAPFDRL